MLMTYRRTLSVWPLQWVVSRDTRFGGREQDVPEGLSVDRGRSSGPPSIRKPVEPDGAIAAVPEVHGGATRD